MALQNLFRQDSDRSNPTLADPYGVQATHGLPVLSKTDGGQTSFITFLSNGECNRALRVYYGAFLLTEFNQTTGARQWRFHKGTSSNGFDDAEQGRPEFFPEIDDCFTEICYVEVRPPAEYGEIDPNKLFVIFEGRVVDDYGTDGVTGNLIVTGRGYSANPMRVGLDILRRGQRMQLPRFHAPSWIAYRAHCDALIEWIGGEGDGITGTYFNNVNLAAPSVAQQIAPFIDFDFTGAARPAGVNQHNFSARFTGQFKSPTTETITFITRADDGVRLWVNGVQLIDNWATQAETERQGSIALVKDTRYDIVVEYFQGGGLGVLRLEYESPTITRQLIPIDRLFSSNAVSRFVPRWSAHVAYPAATEPALAFESLMRRTPDCHWQDVGVNGKLKIKMLVGSDRPAIHQFFFNPNQTIVRSNIVYNSFQTYPRPAEDTPNFFHVSYRDVDRLDEILPEKFIPVDRPEARQNLDGFLMDLGVIPLGVMTQSEADRAGECMMRLGADLNRFVILRGMKGSHKLAKGDFCEVIHNIPNWTLPRLFMVIEESFTRGAAGERDFLLQSISPLFYQDNAHGRIQWNGRGDNVSAYTPPPVVDSATAIAGVRRKPDGGVTSTIEGVVTVADWPHPQQVRVWRKWETDALFSATGRVLLPDASTRAAPYMLEDVPLTAAAPHQLKFVSELRGGGLRRPFADHSVYFVDVTPDLISTPPAPINGTAVRDANGDWLIYWERGHRVPDLIAQGEEVPRYVLRIKDGAGNIVREHYLDAQTIETLSWLPRADWQAGSGFPCNPATITRGTNGSISKTGSLTDSCFYASQAFRGDGRIIFTFDERIPPLNVRVDSDGDPDAPNSMHEFFQATYTAQVPFIFPNFATFKGWRPVANETFGFQMRQGKLLFLGRNNEIIYSGFNDGINFDLPYRVTVALGELTYGEATGLKACRAEMDRPERFLYTADMQKQDFAGVAQSTIRVEVAQLSMHNAVGEGDAANYIFVG